MKIDKETVIFITGAGSGFGLETVKLFYGYGCNVIIADISLTEDAKEFISKVLTYINRKAEPSKILVLDKFDVTNEETIQRDI
jgi:NAD(P)-dependent dehydrogenase (short-subunit alcohol dehydrogenase family)